MSETKFKPRRFVRMFRPTFAAMVEAGTKLQTVRPTPKIMPRPGDLISLRVWTGRPYHSPQRVLREETIRCVTPITIDCHGIRIGAGYLDDDRCDAFARFDGFSNWVRMRDWFELVHGLPFEGIVIFWSVQ
jgi:hypothetical protein